MPTWTEAAAIREWARAQGFDVPPMGRLPARLRNLWMQAGSPYPVKPPPNFAQRVRTYNSTSSVPVNPPDPTVQFVPTADPVRPSNVGNDLSGVTQERTAAALELLGQLIGPGEQGEGVAAPRTPASNPLPDNLGDLAEEEPAAPVRFTVLLVSGLEATVLTAEEVDWFNASRDAYLSQHRFTENTDMQDLDRLLQLELLQYRWNQWVLKGSDYTGARIDDMELAKKIREQSTAINVLKESMGLSKKARDANAAGVAERWSDLLARAKAFGYHREEQLRRALLLMNRLSAIVGQFDRSDDEERQKLGFTDEAAIMRWIREEMIPSYHEVDAHFAANVQRMWQRQ